MQQRIKKREQLGCKKCEANQHQFYAKALYSNDCHLATSLHPSSLEVPKCNITRMIKKLKSK